MSDMAKAARAAMKKKAEGMAKADPHQKVDSSNWTPPEALNADVQTGMRPVSRRAFKKGGKVVGAKVAVRADRAPRKSGGAAYAIAKMNRNQKEANEERDGIKHVGGMKKGGRIAKAKGGESMPLPPKRPPQEVIDRLAKGQSPRETNVEPSDNFDADQVQRLERGYKKGGNVDKKTGRTKKFLGGPMMQQNGMLTGAQPAGMAAVGGAGSAGQLGDPREQLVQKNRLNFGMGASGNPYKKGGKVTSMAWEHSKKDLKEDHKLAKKHGMSMEKWEKSKLDEKHDKQQSMKGLKRGGRLHREDGGETKKAVYNPDDPTSRLKSKDYGGQLEPGKPLASPRKSGGKIEKVMHEYKEGELHSGSKKGPEVKNRKQAIAIALSEARKGRKSGGNVFSGEGYPGKVPGVTGGRIARATGGGTKGKTNVNIIIAAGARPQQEGNPMAPTMPPKPPGGVPVNVPPPSAAAPAAAPTVMPVAMPAMAPQSAGGPPPMGRKSGGRTFNSYKDMKAGAASGEGRLEKTEIAEHKRMMRKDGGHVYPKMKYGAGNGEGRLEKIAEYGLKGPSKSR